MSELNYYGITAVLNKHNISMIDNDCTVTIDFKNCSPKISLPDKTECAYEIVMYDREVYTSVNIVRKQKCEINNTTIHFKLDFNFLAEGFYHIREIQLSNFTEEGFSIKPGSTMFYLSKSSAENFTLSQIQSLMYTELRYFNDIRRNGIGERMKPNNSVFDCHVFVADVYIGKLMKFPHADITPFSRLDNNHYSKYMNDYMISKSIPLHIEDKVIKGTQEPYTRPAVVIKVENIFAQSKEEATDIAHVEVELLLKALSLYNTSYGQIFGDVIIDKTRNGYFYRKRYDSYKGNLFVGMENVKNINTQKIKAQNDELYEFYLELHLDACKEHNIHLKYYKFWNVLEVIARNQNYVGKPRVNFQGHAILSKKGDPLFIQDNAMQLVYELVREYIFNNNKQQIIEKTQYGISTLDDRLIVFYQRRNCVSHRGRCKFMDNSICNRSNHKLSICKDANLEINPSQQALDRITDTYLFDLKHLVRDIINKL